ncbi:MAG: metallophosphoesterase [Chlamydiae bacterium]|nr:metallophosphoesterase [Chlamydiota bacterium]
MLKIAHISDLHFSKISYNPLQFFSKRCVGNFNLLFFRKRFYNEKQLYSLIDHFKSLQIDYVIATGDFTSTSSKEEFAMAKQFFDLLDKNNIKFILVPGNHDNYTKKAYKNSSFFKCFSMVPKKINSFALNDNWWFVGLDTTLPTHWLSSAGLFSKTIEDELSKSLEKIPKDKFILMANHFPLFPNDSRRKILKRSEDLLKLIQKHNNIKLYLHGHTHRRSIADLQGSSLPIVIDSGCTAHTEFGFWSFIELDSALKITSYKHTQNVWNKDRESCFSFLNSKKL